MSNLTNHIEDAKKAHLEWLQRAENLVNNTLDDKVAPLSHESCKFGKLIHSEEFANIDESLMEEIDTIHFLLHDNYSHIYNLLVNNENPSEEELTKAQEFFEMLKPISSTLLESLDNIN